MLVDYYSSLFNLWAPGFRGFRYVVNCQPVVNMMVHTYINDKATIK